MVMAAAGKVLLTSSSEVFDVVDLPDPLPGDGETLGEVSSSA
jgi:hypothetical protein